MTKSLYRYTGVENKDFVVDLNEMPTIYYKYKGRTYRYFPDLFIKSINMIVETKSEYTFRNRKAMNLKKREACLEKGLGFTFFVYKDYKSYPSFY